jgi:hypothetical protein
MLEHYFVRPSTIDRIRASWMAPQIELYVEWMEAKGYHPRNFFRRVPILCHFADFAQQRGCMDLVSASSCVEAFASFGCPDTGRAKAQLHLCKSWKAMRGIQCGRCCDWPWMGVSRQIAALVHFRSKPQLQGLLSICAANV